MMNVVSELERIARDAARRCAADLARHELDERAFDLAVKAFDRTRWWGTPLGAHPREAAHDAELEALQAFLSTYLSEVGR